MGNAVEQRTGARHGAGLPAVARSRLLRWIFAVELAVILVAGARGGLPIADPVERTARPYVFDLISWEVREALVRVPQLVEGLWAPASTDTEAEERQVLDYFLLARDIRQAESELRRLQATGGAASDLAAVQARLADLQSRRARLEDGVEALVSRHAGEELQREELATDFGPFRPILPPVEFELTRTPTVLAVSPRDRIKLQHSIVLRPELTPQEVERIERTVAAEGLSTIVEPTGGFSTYPAMIPDTSVLDFTMSSVVHEWLHAYLFFQPLGWNYFTSGEMRSINETVADIGGKEIGERLAARYRRHLPASPPSPTPQSSQGEQTPNRDAPPAFDFRKEMRETRLEADRLLAEGRIDEAEQYMETRRKVFVANGYLFRKLNQAYFAFHGTYGDSPASVSPIFGYLRSLRERSSSLGGFLKTVARIHRYEDLLAMVDAGAEQQGIGAREGAAAASGQ